MTTIHWPPPYSIRASRRAKNVILQISPRLGLEIIVPHCQKYPPNIEALLIERRPWIEKNLSSRQISPPLLELPENLHLLAIQKTMTFQYQQKENEPLRMICKLCTEVSDDYLITGPIDKYASVVKGLKKILKRTAIRCLVPWLQSLSLETQLFYSSVSFRRQTTLWGSCTAAKKISLNINLLFLPPEITRYVLLHELCHIQHLNHSKRYWDLLKKFDPLCFQHRKALASAGQYLPSWLDH